MVEIYEEVKNKTKQKFSCEARNKRREAVENRLTFQSQFPVSMKSTCTFDRITNWSFCHPCLGVIFLRGHK